MLKECYIVVMVTVFVQHGIIPKPMFLFLRKTMFP